MGQMIVCNVEAVEHIVKPTEKPHSFFKLPSTCCFCLTTHHSSVFIHHYLSLTSFPATAATHSCLYRISPDMVTAQQQMAERLLSTIIMIHLSIGLTLGR